MRIQPHDRFSAVTTLTPAAVADFARAVGDTNPLHHDETYARRMRYGGLVASGPQTSALLMALAGSHFSRDAEMVGLEFTFKFREPVPAGDTVRLEWLVVSVRDTSRRAGRVVELRGRLQTSAGRTAVGARGKVLVSDR